jgi:hypothetical protein
MGHAQDIAYLALFFSERVKPDAGKRSCKAMREFGGLITFASRAF